MGLITITDLTVQYNSKPALCSVGLKVNRGDYLCVVGANGCGKSTLLKAILGLVTPYSGEVVLGVSREKIAYLPQYSKIPATMPASVYEVVLTGAQKSGRRLPFYTKADRKLADYACEMLGITDISKKLFSHLSGGQKQRALLARALCRTPDLLILDEPCAGLDEHICQSLYGILADVNRDRGTAILMVSHNMDEVVKYAKKVLLLDKAVKFYGTVPEWLEFRSSK